MSFGLRSFALKPFIEIPVEKMISVSHNIYFKSDIARVFFILFFYAGAYGQVDPGKVKIITRSYTGYIPSENEIVSASYPYIKTSKKQLDKFINDTIQKIIGIDANKYVANPAESDSINPDNKPAQTDFTFHINFMNSGFISLTIFENNYAAGGANGASHISLPFTFDLRKMKYLHLKDVINDEADSFVCKTIVDKLTETNQNLIADFENEETLQNIPYILDNSISINKKEITVYWPLSYGHGILYADVDLSFDKFPRIFKKEFIRLVRQK